MGNIPLWDYARFTKPGSSHHQAFWNALDDELPAEIRNKLNQGGDLRGIWEAQKTEYAALQIPAKHSVLLQVPYEYQRDNRSGSGYRECFSSSCAMVARFFGCVASDDQYNQVRARYGDTTDTSAQLSALKALGLKASFRQDGRPEDLEDILLKGRPVPVGWLHHGTPSAPTGGGHWAVVIGFDPNAFTFNDPNGEADLVGGGYMNVSNTAGKAVRYSRKNWLPRWRVGGEGGWYIDVSV